MTPNTRKPSKSEVRDNDPCWHWTGFRASWRKEQGRWIRQLWLKGDRWLPYSAIPDPNNTQQGEPT